MPRTGSTATAVWTGAGISATIYSMKLPDHEIPALDDTPLGAGTHRQYERGDKVEPGEIELEFDFNTLKADEIATLLTYGTDTLTITLPLRTAGNTAATLTGTGFFIKNNLGELKTNQLMRLNVTWKFDGKTGPTLTKETTS